MARWLGNILLGLFSVSLCLVLLEISFRLWTSQNSSPMPKQDRPAFYYAPETSSRTHDYETAVERPLNTFRIAVIGDSFTYPTFLQFDDVYSKRLERMLNLRDPAKTPLRAEVLNFGRRGTSTQQQLKILKQALAYRPDLVLLQITLNDPSDVDFGTAVKQKPGRYLYGNLEITAETHPVLNVWKSLGFLAQRIHSSRTLPSMVQYYHDIYDRTNWERFSEALKRFKEITAEEKIGFAAIVFPMFYTDVDERYPFLDLHERIGGQLGSLGIPFLDLRESFRGFPAQRLQVKPGEDTHPNEIAHRIAAEALYGWLESQNLFPDALRIKNKPAREEARRDR